MHLRLAAFAIVVLVLIAYAALARPPENADPALAPWFQQQKIPGLEISCCSQADGRAVQYRIAGDHYEAFLTKAAFPWIAADGWRPVPERAILKGQDNPTGRAIAWVAPWGMWIDGRQFQAGDILCFILPAQV